MSETIADVLGRLARFVEGLPPEFQADGYELMDAIYNVWSDDMVKFAAPPPVVRVEAFRDGRRLRPVSTQSRKRAVQALSRGLFRSTGLSEEEGDDHGQGGEVGE